MHSAGQPLEAVKARARVGPTPGLVQENLFLCPDAFLLRHHLHIPPPHGSQNTGSLQAAALWTPIPACPKAPALCSPGCGNFIATHPCCRIMLEARSKTLPPRPKAALPSSGGRSPDCWPQGWPSFLSSVRVLVLHAPKKPQDG